MLKFRKEICRFSDGITVAVSGGVDSITAAYFLSSAHNIKVFHFNHEVQPELNNRMENAVRKFCDDFELDLVVGRKSDIDLNYEGSSVEAECREYRLESMRRNLNGDVVLAHHLNDMVESNFLNFLKGKDHYRPMPICSEIGSGVRLVRPFSLTTKQDFVDFANRHDINKYVVEDVSNYDQDIRRNWVRHTVLPVIEERYAGLEKVTRKKVKKLFEVA